MKPIIKFIFILSIQLLYAHHLERTNGTILKAFFTPHDNLEEILCSHIREEKSEISIMVYYLTDPFIIEALKKACQRDVKINIIVDYWWTAKNKKSATSILGTLPVKVCKPLKGGVMHHKFVLFKCNIKDKPLIWSGSFNLSKRSQSSNDENIIISDDEELIQQYQKIFDENIIRAIPLEQIPYKPKNKKDSLKISVSAVKSKAQ